MNGRANSTILGCPSNCRLELAGVQLALRGSISRIGTGAGAGHTWSLDVAVMPVASVAAQLVVPRDGRR